MSKVTIRRNTNQKYLYQVAALGQDFPLDRGYEETENDFLRRALTTAQTFAEIEDEKKAWEDASVIKPGELYDVTIDKKKIEYTKRG